jgi:hypothetical protein
MLGLTLVVLSALIVRWEEATGPSDPSTDAEDGIKAPSSAGWKERLYECKEQLRRG